MGTATAIMLAGMFTYSALLTSNVFCTAHDERPLLRTRFAITDRLYIVRCLCWLPIARYCAPTGIRRRTRWCGYRCWT
jgi:hypothetical protein